MIKFHAFGFFFPAIASAIYLGIHFRKFRLWHVPLVLLTSFIVFQFYTVDCTAVWSRGWPALLVPLVLGGVDYKKWRCGTQPPASYVFAVTFLALAIPDVIAAFRYAPICNATAAVGGAGLIDGLFLTSVGTLVLYWLIAVAIYYISNKPGPGSPNKYHLGIKRSVV